MCSVSHVPKSGIGGRDPLILYLEAVLPLLVLAMTVNLKSLQESVQFSSVQSLSHVRLVAIPWTAARQASLFVTNSWRLLKLMSIELAMPSKYLILCCPLLLPPSIFPSIRVFSNESVLHIRWPKYWSFSFSNSPSNEYSGLISFRIDWFDLFAVPFSSVTQLCPTICSPMDCSTLGWPAPPTPTNSWRLLKLMSTELVMTVNHLILCCPLLLPPSIFPSIRIF